jgi:hypothetical protein
VRSDDDYRALQEQAHLLNELTRHPGWPVLVDFLEVISRAAKLRVLNGKLDSIDAYKSVTGELVGIHKAIDAPSVVAGMLEEEKRQRVERDEAVT